MMKFVCTRGGEETMVIHYHENDKLCDRCFDEIVQEEKGDRQRRHHLGLAIKRAGGRIT